VRLVQLQRGSERRLANLVSDRLQLLRVHQSVYSLADHAIRSASTLADAAGEHLSDELLDYEEIYAGRGPWRILPSADHPESAAKTLVSGTGLTHMASVERRNSMHAAAQQETDSVRMYRWGVEGGKPALGHSGAAPEWFYKGNGTIVRAHNEPLIVPEFAEDGGEEPEIAGVYLIDGQGKPRRIGLTQGNEFSDHQFEKRNYLYLAHSKLRTCSIGPELVIDPSFGSVPGRVSIERNGALLWSSGIRTGEEVMCHSLANIEHHHFKYEQHRSPGDLHIHFFGADAFSYGEGITLDNGDVMEVHFEGFGRALRNPVQVRLRDAGLTAVLPL
jgi:hypothetical protein